MGVAGSCSHIISHPSPWRALAGFIFPQIKMAVRNLSEIKCQGAWKEHAGTPRNSFKSNVTSCKLSGKNPSHPCCSPHRWINCTTLHRIIRLHAFFFLLGTQANWYRANSFTQYRVKQVKRKRRELVPAPVSMANEFYTNIALQVRVSPNSSNVVIFLASNSLGTEFNRIDVSSIKSLSR